MSKQQGVVDCMLCNPESVLQIGDFKIDAKIPESDHHGLSVTTIYKTHNAVKLLHDNSKWTYHKTYKWSIDDIPKINSVMKDAQSKKHRERVIDALSELADTTSVATLFNNFLTQAIEHVCCVTNPAVRGKVNKTPWFDEECREKRSRAIEAGHRVDCTTDRREQLEACKIYKQCPRACSYV